MTVRVCPTVVIGAPIERVWSLLGDPMQWESWADASLEHIEPPGPASPGQAFVVSSVGFGRRWRFHFTVDAVDEAGYRLRFTARFPFGMVEHAQIGCVAVDEAMCRVTFE
jgi:uncharacterized protein YndB with AHSA1/START domain